MKLNTATDRTKKLVELLASLEANDYFRMSDDGRQNIDDIWKLLGMPTRNDLDKQNEEEE